MGQNVLINKKSAVHAASQGVLTTVDPCWTPVGKSRVLVNYTNIARSADAAQTAATVFVNGNPVCTKDSVFAKSTGDEAGSELGSKSGTISGQAEFLTSSPNVFIEGVPAVRQNDLMVSNNQNTAPAPLVQPGGSAPATKNLEAREAIEGTTGAVVESEVAGIDKHLLKGLLVTEDI
ncbi:MAG: DUF4150 domain-containing protein [Thermodesulfobacteriota bacterium]